MRFRGASPNIARQRVTGSGKKVKPPKQENDMTAEEDAKSRFPNDIAVHQMQVKLDAGLYRHLRFKRPNTINMYFDIVTWPNHLCFTGDMGSFLFTRVEDMFEFFRQDPTNKEPRINPYYWMEKCIAVDKSGGIKKYSSELFRRCVLEELEAFIEDRKDYHTDEEFAELRVQVEEEVLRYADDGHEGALRSAMDFEWTLDKRQVFPDFYEHSLEEYTYHYIWACLAIVHAIGEYDKTFKKGDVK
jgi:hypothetical protein